MPRPIWLLTDAAMDAHRAPGHPERPERREAAAAGVRDAAGDGLHEPAVLPATDPELLAVHRRSLLDALEAVEAGGGGWMDPDTYVVPGSLAAARLAAGATIRAAEAAVTGEAEVAFAAVRPPGHHAGASRASGFCLFNNVAVAVAAIRRDRAAARVTIVDWDVHHGNGTQELFEHDPDVLYLSTHQSPFYPGTGRSDERGVGPAEGTVLNREIAAGAGDAEFVGAWRDELLPALDAFAPDAIIVSAGYDAHVADPLAMLRVTEAGYESVARLLGRSAAMAGVPGVALALEGGYDLAAIRGSVAATVRGLLEGRASAAARA